MCSHECFDQRSSPAKFSKRLIWNLSFDFVNIGKLKENVTPRERRDGKVRESAIVTSNHVLISPSRVYSQNSVTGKFCEFIDVFATWQIDLFTSRALKPPGDAWMKRLTKLESSDEVTSPLKATATAIQTRWTSRSLPMNSNQASTKVKQSWFAIKRRVFLVVFDFREKSRLPLWSQLSRSSKSNKFWNSQLTYLLNCRVRNRAKKRLLHNLTSTVAFLTQLINCLTDFVQFDAKPNIEKQ